MRETLLSHPTVVEVHDLHVWTITSGLESLSAHIVVGQEPPTDLLPELQGTLRRHFGIDHVTLQIEAGACRVQEMPI